MLPIARDGVDVAIRNLRAPTLGLVSGKLLDVRGVPDCALKLLKGPVPLNSPADLAHHALIHVTARPKEMTGVQSKHHQIPLRSLQPS